MMDDVMQEDKLFKLLNKIDEKILQILYYSWNKGFNRSKMTYYRLKKRFNPTNKF